MNQPTPTRYALTQACCRCGAAGAGRGQFDGQTDLSRIPGLGCLDAKAHVCRACHGQLSWRLTLGVIVLFAALNLPVILTRPAPALVGIVALVFSATMVAAALLRLLYFRHLRGKQTAEARAPKQPLVHRAHCAQCGVDSDGPGAVERLLSTRLFFFISWLDHRIFLCRPCYGQRLWLRVLFLAASGTAIFGSLALSGVIDDPRVLLIVLPQQGLIALVAVARIAWLRRSRPTR